MHPVNRYFNFRQRARRTILTIAFLYAILNGSQVSAVYGLWHLGWASAGIADPVWLICAWTLIAAVVIVLLVFMARRVRLATTQANLPFLAMQTLVVVAVIAAAVLAAGRVFTAEGAFDFGTYLTIVLWTWQIPVGYWIGTGLSWAAVDRKVAGRFTTEAVDGDAS